MTKAIVFDIDGVLIDVSKSYRLSIKKTAEFFLCKEISGKEVEKVKLSGGFNDDWDCTEEIIKKNGKIVEKREIISKFQEFYLGKNFNGLIKNEKLLIKTEVIGELSKRYKLAIFTGRPRIEAEFALKKGKILQYFSCIIAMDDIKKGKPEPEGLLKLKKELKADELIYIGDAPDDLEVAKNAKADFIGVIPPYANKEKLKNIFKENRAKIILDDINDIVKVIK